MFVCACMRERERDSDEQWELVTTVVWNLAEWICMNRRPNFTKENKKISTINNRYLSLKLPPNMKGA